MTEAPVHARAEGSRFAKFLLVGAVGFAIDAGLLMVLVHSGHGPFLSRIISAPVAIIGTFVLNRTFTFSDTKVPLWRSFFAYIGTQAVGLGVNFALYGGLIAFAPATFGSPLPAIVVASGVALSINYIGSRFLAFRVGNGSLYRLHPGGRLFFRSGTRARRTCRTE